MVKVVVGNDLFDLITNTNSKNYFSTNFHLNVIQVIGLNSIFQIQVLPKNFNLLFMVNYFVLLLNCNSVDDSTPHHLEAVQQHARVDENRSFKVGYSDWDLINTKDTTLKELITNTEAFMLIINSNLYWTFKR